MNIKLIAFTPNPEKIAYIASRTCYSKESQLEVLDKELTDKEKNLIRKIIKSGHTSVIEHINFTFYLEGISRSASHQLVRHRIASYSQQSQRYVKYSKDEFIIPPSIKNNKTANNTFIEFMNNVNRTYEKLKTLKIPKEDCRFVLPNAVKTNIIVSMNARSLWNFFNLRCCTKSQWEIRKIAWKMLGLVKEVAPALFENAGPWCFDGDCPENDTECRKKIRNQINE